MPDSSRHRRQATSPVGEGLVWTSRIMAIGLAMFLPGVAGTWLDERLGSRLFGPLGFLLGFLAALVWLTRLTKPPRAS
jgi:hypothetical protein